MIPSYTEYPQPILVPTTYTFKTGVQYQLLVNGNVNPPRAYIRTSQPNALQTPTVPANWIFYPSVRLYTDITMSIPAGTFPVVSDEFSNSYLRVN